MDYKTYTQRSSYLLYMLEKGQVASPSDVAEKYDCSEKTVRRMINYLRDDGHDIKYSKHGRKYLLRKK